MEIQSSQCILEFGLSKLLFLVALSWLSCCLVAEVAIRLSSAKKKQNTTPLDTKDWKCWPSLRLSVTKSLKLPSKSAVGLLIPQSRIESSPLCWEQRSQNGRVLLMLAKVLAPSWAGDAEMCLGWLQISCSVSLTRSSLAMAAQDGAEALDWCLFGGL